MEEHRDRGCSVVYYCDRQDEEICELYDGQHLPRDATGVAQKAGWRKALHSNVRMLLDEDQGGFHEGETCTGYSMGIASLIMNSVCQLACTNMPRET